MKVGDKYTTKDDPQPGKKVISEDAFAVCEFIEELTIKLNEAANRLK